MKILFLHGLSLFTLNWTLGFLIVNPCSLFSPKGTGREVIILRFSIFSGGGTSSAPLHICSEIYFLIKTYADLHCKPMQYIEEKSNIERSNSFNWSKQFHKVNLLWVDYSANEDHIYLILQTLWEYIDCHYDLTAIKWRWILIKIKYAV